MHRKPNQLIAAIAFGLLLFGAGSAADAGFIAAPEFASGDGGAIGLGLDGASGAGSTDQPVAENEKPEDDRQLLPQPGILPTYNAQAGSGSMTSPTSISAGGMSPISAVALTPKPPSPGQLRFRLARQRERFHPRFLKTRVFRPPRV